MFGPRHTQLGASFVNDIVASLNAHRVHCDLPSKDVDHDGYAFFPEYFGHEHLYAPYLARKPQVTHQDEVFFVRSLFVGVSPKKYFNKHATSYQDHLCANSEPDSNAVKAIEENYCPCEDEYDSDDDDDDKEIYTAVSIPHFLDTYAVQLQKNEHAKFSSGPTDNWFLRYWYRVPLKEGGYLHVYAKLGSAPRTFAKTFASSFSSKMVDGVSRWCANVEHNPNYTTLSYEPRNIYFEDDFIPLIKNVIHTKAPSFEYKQRRYSLVAAEYCKTEATNFSCGCNYGYCKPLSPTQGLAKMPTKQRYYFHFSTSVTPEWYLKVQGGWLCRLGWLQCQVYFETDRHHPFHLTLHTCILYTHRLELFGQAFLFNFEFDQTLVGAFTATRLIHFFINQICIVLLRFLHTKSLVHL